MMRDKENQMDKAVLKKSGRPVCPILKDEPCLVQAVQFSLPVAGQGWAHDPAGQCDVMRKAAGASYLFIK